MMNSKILIAYYSRAGENYVNGGIVDLSAGNTEVAAKHIQAAVGGELFHIDTRYPYPADYTRTTEVAMQELRNKTRPELRNHIGSIDQYDTIFLGYPNWWSTMPMAVFTFLESHDFSGKIIYPFCTHEGSGMGRSVEDIQKLCIGAQVKQGLAIRGGSVGGAEKEIFGWISEQSQREAEE